MFRRQAPISLPKIATDDVETFLINDEIREYIVDEINAFCDGSEEEDEEDDFEED
jgi:hypothetical protein